jgi:hypothetical protein
MPEGAESSRYRASRRSNVIAAAGARSLAPLNEKRRKRLVAQQLGPFPSPAKRARPVDEQDG